MSKFQPDYDKAKQKESVVNVPEIKKQIQDLQNKKRETQDSDIRKGIDAQIKTLQIKLKSYQSGDPVKEYIDYFIKGNYAE